MCTIPSDEFGDGDLVSFRMPSGMDPWMGIDLTAPNEEHSNISSIWFPINRVSF